MKKTLIVLALIGFTTGAFAQTKTSTSATVAFDASTEKDALPKAENKTVVAQLNTKTGEIGFEAAVKNFAFSNPLIQEHFNGERWLNSEKFASFTFVGKVAEIGKVNFAKNGVYNVSVTGELTVKDKSKTITTPATLEVKNGVVAAKANFTIVLADYGVAVGDSGKIAGEPKITVSAELK
jgi:polyisoprenoid-binding protein YceI